MDKSTTIASPEYFMKIDQYNSSTARRHRVTSALTEAQNVHRLQRSSCDLRDLQFQLGDAATFKAVRELRNPLLQKKKGTLSTIIISLNELLEEREIPFVDIHGRIKGVYSTYRKMEKYDMDINRVHDLVAVRIITEDEEMCYTTLEALHCTFAPVPGRLKDYIARPKGNGYKSLHTSLKGGNNAVFEVQIRTPKIHTIAEFGSAAHWLYDLSRERQFLRSVKV